MGPPRRAWLGPLLLVVAVAAAVLLSPRAPSPTPADGAPGCVACHAGDPGPPHDALGCAPCHLGDPDATTADAAHAGLEAEPGALDTVDRTCGRCHPAQTATVRASPMATGRGIVGVDRFAFGELPTPDTEETLADTLAAEAPTPAQEHVRKLCAGCHLGTRRANRDDAIVAGGSGCSACHAGPRAEDAAALAGWPSAGVRVAPAAPAPAHPAVTAEVPDTRCLGCHSRSARISLSYAGFAETEDCADPVALHDGRPGCRVAPDVHAAAGMPCVACHGRTDLMGDGVSRAHQEQAVSTRCEGCHAPDAHAAPGHERLVCVACHAAWAPTCPACHTARDPDSSQWDFGVGAPTPGRWVERGGGFGVAPPALGVRPDGRIGPAIPGMIATIEDRPPLRRFALVDPHTTARAGRACVDCHRSPRALGLGEGALDVEALAFTPARAAAGAPELAADGWTRLLPETPGEGTRVGARSLDAAEQRRVLRVGVCLACHAPEHGIWADFPSAVARRAASPCAAPRGWWDDLFQAP